MRWTTTTTCRWLLLPCTLALGACNAILGVFDTRLANDDALDGSFASDAPASTSDAPDDDARPDSGPSRYCEGAGFKFCLDFDEGFISPQADASVGQGNFLLDPIAFVSSPASLSINTSKDNPGILEWPLPPSCNFDSSWTFQISIRTGSSNDRTEVVRIGDTISGNPYALEIAMDAKLITVGIFQGGISTGSSAGFAAGDGWTGGDWTVVKIMFQPGSLHVVVGTSDTQKISPPIGASPLYLKLGTISYPPTTGQMDIHFDNVSAN